MSSRDTDNLEAMADELSAENARLRAEIDLARRIVCQPLEQTEAEVKALEPGSTPMACRLIDLANLKGSHEAGARQHRELRAEVARLAEENASLREQGRRAEIERDRAKQEASRFGAEVERLVAKVNRMVRSASLEDIQGVGR